MDKVEIYNKIGHTVAALQSYAAGIVTYKVDSDETSQFAKTKLSEVNTYLKQIEEKRVELTKPLLDEKKSIDDVAKSLVAILEPAKKHLNDQTVTFQSLKAAALRIENEKKLALEKDLADKKQAELERINKLRNLIVQKVTELLKDVNFREKIPNFINLWNNNIDSKMPEFNYTGNELIAAKKEIIDMLWNLKDTFEEPINVLNDFKARYDMLVVESQSNVQKDLQNFEKKAEHIVDNAKKGMREYIKFEIEEPGKVPLNFLSPDEKKIRAFIDQDKEMIKSMLANGKQPISGVKVYVEQIMIAR